MKNIQKNSILGKNFFVQNDNLKNINLIIYGTLHYPDTILARAVEDKVAKKMQKHLSSHGLDCTPIPDGTMDFEYDYPRSSLEGPIAGIASRGVFKVKDTIDFIDILKRKTITESQFAPGGSHGMGIAEGTTWKMRYFLSFPREIDIGPLNIGTMTKVLKGRFHSKVEDFLWDGYGKLTTLPPGMIKDDIIAVLNADSELKELMMNALVKEQVITVSVYKPKTKVNYEIAQIVKDDSYWYKYKPKKESHAKIMITSEWKSQKDLFVDSDTLKLYQKMASDIKETVERVSYHLVTK